MMNILRLHQKVFPGSTRGRNLKRGLCAWALCGLVGIIVFYLVAVSNSAGHQKLNADSPARTQRQEILCSPDRLADSAQKLLKIGMVFNEINIIGVDHQKI